MKKQIKLSNRANYAERIIWALIVVKVNKQVALDRASTTALLYLSDKGLLEYE